MLFSLSELILFYNFLGSAIVSDPFYPLPIRRIRKYKKLRKMIKLCILSYCPGISSDLFNKEVSKHD